MNSIKNLFNSAKKFLHPYQFSFISQHNYLKATDYRNMKKILSANDEKNFKILRKYENLFSKKIGRGFSLSFASARMAFYQLLIAINIKTDDEVLLLGFTCAVMANTIIRSGAKPVYVDIDITNLGSSFSAIKTKITKNTKMVVIQHSFGIPCEVKKIQNFLKVKKIFLLEDCSLSFGSSSNKIKTGNFGDAAIFSTDHTKNINTMLGGVLYTKKKNLYNKVRNDYDNISHLSKAHQKSILNQIKFESIFLQPYLFPRYSFFYFFFRAYNKNPFFNNDFKSVIQESDYPFPAKMPPFLAYLGILELKRWERKCKVMRKTQNLIRSQLNLNDKIELIPSAYSDTSKQIFSNRFVIIDKENVVNFSEYDKYFNYSSNWFKQPLHGASCELVDFGYKLGSCINSELTCKYIYNIPCNVDRKYLPQFIEALKKIFT